jgi:hypothetical protein
MIIYDYYKTRSDLQCFVEDFFLTWKSWFGLKIELFNRIIDYLWDELQLTKKQRKTYINKIQESAKIRNYFAHESFSHQNEDGLFRTYQRWTYWVDLHILDKDFSNHSKIAWEIVGRIQNLWQGMPKRN